MYSSRTEHSASGVTQTRELLISWSTLPLRHIFKLCGSVFVNLLFNVLPIVCGDSVFAFVLVCITLCPF